MYNDNKKKTHTHTLAPERQAPFCHKVEALHWNMVVAGVIEGHEYHS